MKITVHTRNRLSHFFFSGLSMCIVLMFAIWWFDPSHIPSNFTGFFRVFDVILFVLVSYVIWHPIVMDLLTWVISLHINDLPTEKPVGGLRVAFITTIVPNKEPLSLLHLCLPAMVGAKYPHDTWVLDEGNSEEVKKVCMLYGALHFSRCGIERFNTVDGKFTKTKGGNHNSWYETYGNKYDIVAQIDTDFVPRSDFLIKTLGYFRDPTVAFVGTPQIYGNTSHSFISQGAAEQQYNFYGAVLRGLSGIGMTLLIGANHVIRVSAFQRVGHYTAHITEDLITGIKLHASGYTSIYVPQKLAIGEGPANWDSYFRQQLRWSYGCMDILFHHSMRYLRKMGFRQSLYYFFLQQHYFSGLAMAISIVLLSFYFVFGFRAANVDLFTFLTLYSFVMLIVWLMSVWLQRYNIDRKKEGELLLAGKIISIAVWPIWFLSFLKVLTGKRLKYKVTPKGEQDIAKNSPRVFFAHFWFAGFAFLGVIASLFTHRNSPIMLFWGVSAVCAMLAVPFVGAIVRLVLFVKNVVKNMFVAIRRVNSFQSESSEYTHELFLDSLFLTIIVLLSVVTYITKLGFYSDDWSFLGNFTLAQNQSLLGFFNAATTSNTFMRPVQNIYDAALFWLFGMQPLGYQIVNTIVFIAIVLFSYVILRRIRIPRILSLAICLVFLLLPNYSTDRFWYAAYQVNISYLFYLLYTYAGLRALSLKTSYMFVWKCISLASLIISGLSYEVALPLVLITLLLFWNPQKGRVQNNAVFITINGIVLLYLILFKLKTTTRLGTFNYPGDVVHLVTTIFQTNFGALGVKLPVIWGEILAQYMHPSMVIVSLSIYLSVFVYLFFVAAKRSYSYTPPLYLLCLSVAGLLVFLFGYAIFFTNNRVGFSPTGIDNRVAIAASLGIAVFLVGSIGLLCKLIPSRKYAQWVFCVCIAIVCTGGFLVINTLASFWIAAYQQSSVVLSDIHSRFAQLPKNSTLLLDGVCPYMGPGIVFESQWDLKGALEANYHDPTIKADIVTPRLKLLTKTIETQIYTFKAEYPYTHAFVYNVKMKQTYPIPNIQAAESYFNEYNPDHNNNCPVSSAGNGVAIF